VLSGGQGDGSSVSHLLLQPARRAAIAAAPTPGSSCCSSGTRSAGDGCANGSSSSIISGDVTSASAGNSSSFLIKTVLLHTAKQTIIIAGGCSGVRRVGNANANQANNTALEHMILRIPLTHVNTAQRKLFLKCALPDIDVCTASKSL
jgi:hypothetical protein